MTNQFDLHPGKVHFASSDVGWVVGHSNMIYGPPIVGAAGVFFEGKPVIPDAGIIWRLCEKYKVTCLYIAPTGVRVVKKEDFDGEHIKKSDLSKLESIGVVGERCDPATIRWLHQHVPHAILTDTWWQTETGWPMTGLQLNRKVFGPVFPTLPGSVTRATPGFVVRIVGDDNQELPADTLGKVVVKLPMPPSFMLTLWGNDQAFIDKYLADVPGYYLTGDAGVIDSRGYLQIMTRIDDVINTCGHRISTGQLEEAINNVEGVVESAVVAYDEEIRGECALGFVVLRGLGATGMSEEEKAKVSASINDAVRRDVGAFARMTGVILVERLPKTRSGKILRGVMRKIANGQEYVFPATIDDASTLDLIKEVVGAWKEGLKK